MKSIQQIKFVGDFYEKTKHQEDCNSNIDQNNFNTNIFYDIKYTISIIIILKTNILCTYTLRKMYQTFKRA